MRAMVSLPETWVQRSASMSARASVGSNRSMVTRVGGVLDAGEDGEGGAGDVEEGPGTVEAVGDAQAHASAGDEAVAKHGAVAEEDALGKGGGAGGVLDEERVVRGAGGGCGAGGGEEGRPVAVEDDEAVQVGEGSAGEGLAGELGVYAGFDAAEKGEEVGAEDGLGEEEGADAGWRRA